MARLKVNPTRIELKKCKARLKATVSGHKLLKDKADEMIRRFLVAVKDAASLRAAVEQELLNALKNFALARAVSGTGAVDTALSVPAFSAAIVVSLKNVMGIEVPEIRITQSDAKPQIPYALASTPPELDEAIITFYAVIGRLLSLAEIEKTCALLAEEIQKTRRRVNALEHILIPELKQTIHYIQMKLDENERGALVRLMKVKSQIENKQ